MVVEERLGAAPPTATTLEMFGDVNYRLRSIAGGDGPPTDTGSVEVAPLQGKGKGDVQPGAAPTAMTRR